MTDDAPALNAFAPASEADWRGLVDKVLKGAPFEKLVGRTYDGLPIQPLYPRASDDSARALRAAPGRWDILARVDNPDPARANAQALEDLAQGATGLHLVFAGSVGAYGFGLPDASPETLGRVLEGVHLDAGIRIEIDLSPATKDAAAHILDLAAARGYDPAALNIGFGFDPVGQMAASGRIPMPWPAFAAFYGEIAKGLLDRGHVGAIGAIDARPVHAAGGSEAQELAFALGSGVACLRAFEGAGIPLDRARSALTFRMAADADEFLGIAKFRALRRLWARVEDACGLAPKPLTLHVETAWRMMTRRDPWVNLLRGTVATFSAALGGADAISVLPFTQALGLPDDFARRLARNTQLVLLEESNLDKVADPAAGAGGFEALTDELCRAAWAIFQADEQGEGQSCGIVAALEAGRVQDAIAKVRAEREKALRRRKDPLTGVSEFPNVAEANVDVLAPLATDADVTPPGLGDADFPALTPMRLALPFEKLRDRAEARARRPKVFLANLGPIAAFTARSMFAKNVYEAGGFEAPGNDGFASPEALAEGFRASGADVACLCSSDAVYAQWGVAAAKALAAAGARQIAFAGRPGELEAALNEAGVTAFIFTGADIVTLLSETHDRLVATD